METTERTVLTCEDVAELLKRSAAVYEGLDEEEIIEGQEKGYTEIIDLVLHFLNAADHFGGFYTKYLLNLYDVNEQGIELKPWVYDAIRGNGPIDVTYMGEYVDLISALGEK